MSAHPTPVEYPEKIDAAVLKVAGVVVLGAIMSILDITVVNVALPTFQQVFAPKGGDPGRLLDRGVDHHRRTPSPSRSSSRMTGWAADRFGTKRLYMLAAAAVHRGLGAVRDGRVDRVLIGFRVLQGLGGGMLMPLGMTIMTSAAGPQRMGRLMAILGVPMLLGPIFGPILGGWLIDNACWHWIFLINVPIGPLALVYAALVAAR